METIHLKNENYGVITPNNSLLSEGLERKRAFLSRLAEILLLRGLSKEVARAILNGNPLFETDRRLAIDCFDAALSDSGCDFAEEISFIDAAYLHLGGKPSKEANRRINEILQRLLIHEKQEFDAILSIQSHEREALELKLASLEKELRGRQIWALVCLLLVLIGVFVLFYGFGRAHWWLVATGGFMLLPSLFITDVQGALVQFRRDRNKQRVKNQLHLQLLGIHQGIEQGRQRLLAIQVRLSSSSANPDEKN